MAITALNKSGVVILVNKSGGAVAQGDTVIVSGANAGAFTTTTTASFIDGIIGVVIEPNGIANDASGAVAVYGYVPKINLSASASLGDLFHTHSVAKQSAPHAAPLVAGDVGQVLGTGTSPAGVLFGAPSQTSAATETPLPPRAFSGLELTNDTDTDHDIAVSPGGCRDDADSYNLILSTVITKQIDAAWAAGDDAGGLDTGAAGNDTWYYMFLIRKDSDGSIDALFSASLASPTMPAGYTYKKFIGAVKTNGSANIRPFKQHGNFVTWADSTLTIDISVSNLTTARTLYALPWVPLGLNVRARGHVTWSNGTANIAGILCSPDLPDVAVAVNGWPNANTRNPGASVTLMSTQEIVTDTSAQIAARSAAASTILQWATAGWEYIR